MRQPIKKALAAASVLLIALALTACERTGPGYTADRGPATEPTEHISASTFAANPSSCVGKIVDGESRWTGDPLAIRVRVDQLPSTATTYEASDCVFAAPVFVWGKAPADSYPLHTLKIHHARFEQGLQVYNQMNVQVAIATIEGGLRLATTTGIEQGYDWSPAGMDMPVQFAQVYVHSAKRYAPPGCPPTDGCWPHDEALSGFGWPKGVQFKGVTFVQDGPITGNTVTGIVNWHGINTVFDENWFDWGPYGSPSPGSDYPLYITGPGGAASGNTVSNSFIAAGNGGAYLYYDGDPNYCTARPTFTNTKDMDGTTDITSALNSYC